MIPSGLNGWKVSGLEDITGDIVHRKDIKEKPASRDAVNDSRVSWGTAGEQSSRTTTQSYQVLGQIHIF